MRNELRTVNAYQNGDFSELFGKDAIEIAPLLGLAITRREKRADSEAMTGFPNHQFDIYAAKLAKNGIRLERRERD